MIVNEELLSELEAAANAASQGEWMATGPSCGHPMPVYLDAVIAINDDEESTVCSMPNWSEEYWEERTANAEFIAQANPATILALLAHIADLKAERAELKRDAERYRLYRMGMTSPEALDASIDRAMQEAAP